MANTSAMGSCIPQSSCILLTCRCIVGHLEEHRGGHGAWRIHHATIGVGWVPHCNASWWRMVDIEDNNHNALMMGVCGVHCGRMLWHMWEAVRTIHRTLLKGWPRRVPCLRHCADAAGVATAKPLHQNSNGCNKQTCGNVGSTWWPSSRPRGWWIYHVVCLMSSSGNGVGNVG